MTRKAVFYVLFAVWLLLFVGSFVAYLVTAPDDMGFTKGLNRITAFLGWQFAAGFAGLITWMQAHVFERGSIGRWVGRAPAILAGLLFGAIASVVVWVRVAPDPAPAPAPDRAVTAPVGDLDRTVEEAE